MAGAPATPATGAGAGAALSIKLLVDTNAKRVLYAEAGKDVVDFLFSLLTLPLGTVAKLVDETTYGTLAGSVGNLYGTVSTMDARYLACSGHARNALLAPAGGHIVGHVLPLPQAAAMTKAAAGSFFHCNKASHQDCCDYIAEACGTPCPVCDGEMASEVEIVRKPESCGTGFVHDLVTYTIKDDLSVAPMSTISGITLILSASGVTSIGALEEKTVPLRYKEGLDILTSSLHSKKVLTEVFLGKKRSPEKALLREAASRATARRRR